ncbi:MAG: RpiB/LacA/LacB family sugar-phosphate isomerase [Candidatus Paceibacterota bacterium]
MIYLGADHRGYELKEKLKKFLEELGHDHEDMGAYEYNKDDDYPDFAKAVAEKVTSGEGNKGIVVCGSGIGIAIAANKVKGIRAGTATDAKQAKDSVNDEDLNVLALPADFIDEKQAKDIVEAFLDTPFSGIERHVRRVNKIKELEK